MTVIYKVGNVFIFCCIFVYRASESLENKTCSENCLIGTETLQEVCDENNGDCLNGCIEGFVGSNCTDRCSDIIRDCKRCERSDSSGDIICIECVRNTYRSNGLCIDCNYWCAGNFQLPLCRENDGYCSHGCKVGRYGFRCSSRCSSTCIIQGCHRETGHCLDGCGYTGYCGPTCESPCQDGCLSQHCNQSCHCMNGCTPIHWGDRCENACNQNCNKPPDLTGRVCKEQDGRCLFGCYDSRFWGTECTEHCSNGCLNGTCGHELGDCMEGCSNSTIYGLRCDIPCNENCLGGTCESENGYCDEGCKIGTYGEKCEKNCKENCIDGVCERTNGNCNIGCLAGLYGDKCNMTCSKNCIDEKCKRETGDCFLGCEVGRYGNLCESVCNDKCLNHKCERSGGKCTYGCIPNYQGSKCEMVITQKDDNENESSQDKTVLLAAVCGWSLFVSLLAIVAVWIVRKRLMVHGNPENQSNAGTDDNQHMSVRQMHTTLQSEQRMPNDATNYEAFQF